MNQLVTLNPAIPAHLRDRAARLMAINANIAGGIKKGARGAHISIEASRWRLIDATGEETVLNTFELDVIVVGANPYISKTYYDTKWVKGQDSAPACFSDNGVGPSASAAKPQFATCAPCPQNVWGSKITEQGKKTRACGDTKKIAIVLANNPTGVVYELRVPTMSMGSLADLAQLATDKDIPLGALVLRLTFDTTVSHPKIIFAPKDYLTPEQTAAVERLEGSREVIKAVGLDDVAAEKPAPIQVVVDNTPPPFLGHPDPEPAPVQTEAKRTRRTKAEMEAAAAKETAPVTAFFDKPATTPAAAVVTSPTATSKELDDLLAGVM